MEIFKIMNDLNAKEPFVKMYELRGLSPSRRLFICKVWSFQSNNLRCHMSKYTWAEFLGCSEKTVDRIKDELRELNIIQTDRSFVRLLYNMEDLITMLNEHYPKLPKKNKENIPFWEKEGSHSLPVSSQNDFLTSQNSSGNDKNATNDGQNLLDGHQSDVLLDNPIRELHYKLIRTPLSEEYNWSLEAFEVQDIPNLGFVDFNSGEVKIRNQVLSLWYKEYSKEELKQHSVELFCNENFFSVFFRILQWVDDCVICFDDLKFVNINQFLKLIQKCYLEYQANESTTVDSLSFEVALDVQLIIFEQGREFRNYISKLF